MSTLREVLGLDSVKGDVGIEIEVEFVANRNYHLPELNKWYNVNDGSLRNVGTEFVSLPLLMSEVPKALEEVLKVIVDNKPINTSRTSVHVHVNCLNLTPLQIMTALTYAWCVEEGLLNQCAKHRRGNRFCLSIRDSIFLMKKVYDMSSNNIYTFNVPAREYKYANIAYHNLCTKGTIEFRGMDGRYDQKHLDKWVNICHNVVHKSIKYFNNPSEVIERLLLGQYTDIPGNDFFVSQKDVEENCMLLYPLTSIDWKEFEGSYLNKKVKTKRSTMDNIIDDAFARQGLQAGDQVVNIHPRFVINEEF